MIATTSEPAMLTVLINLHRVPADPALHSAIGSEVRLTIKTTLTA